MKKLAVLLVLLSLGSCKGQEKDQNPEKETINDSIVKPKGQWNVTREYDELGNLIKYDSVYSWHYSNRAGDSLRVNLDSIMDNFKRYFGEMEAPSLRRDFSYFPKADSLMMKDFFSEDYFFRNWERHHPEMQQFMKRMDSIRNHFLREYHPGLLDSKN
ncbi:hypothetical protein [Sediminicola luteus]|uniref:DUF4296 domain-containing protein n=1 Tax=Sediminicola luteus TaxID=319238 RepID=A0ABV2TUX2_9FLAO